MSNVAGEAELTYTVVIQGEATQLQQLIDK